MSVANANAGQRLRWPVGKLKHADKEFAALPTLQRASRNCVPSSGGGGGGGMYVIAAMNARRTISTYTRRIHVI